MTTADKIRELIEEKGVTQRQFAELVGIHYITLCNNLKNDNFSHKSIEKIADALHLSVYDLLADEAQSKATFSNVEGYIEYNGKIQKIRDFRNLKRLVNEIEQQELYMKARQAKLPKQNAIELEDITLLQWEEYDATQVEVKSFRHHYDIVDDSKFNVGNMCAGYPFELCGVMFNNSESAYIAGIYSNNTAEHRRLQEALIASNDGYRAKKEYRHKRYDHIKRSDWEEFNVEWMKFVVWQKCKGNQEFANLLKTIPDTAMIVENSTGMTGATAQVWGCFNKELEELRNAKETRFEIEHSNDKEFRNKKSTMLNIERNKWNNYGIWSGKNYMGKIIKMCSICLKKGIELPIDYELLRSKHIHLLGQELTF